MVLAVSCNREPLMIVMSAKETEKTDDVQPSSRLAAPRHCCCAAVIGRWS
jgi:hypothetical protein